MPDWSLLYAGLAAMLVLGGLTWLASLRLADVSIVDSVWSLFFLTGAIVYLDGAAPEGLSSWLTLFLVIVWSLRLCIYLTWRNHGRPEDRRYRAMRERNGPGFALRSLLTVFTLQAGLAWIISLPLLAALQMAVDTGVLFWSGLVLTTSGIVVETIADWQLARFLADPVRRDGVMDHGLWRYSRHPNYFGECCVWWGFYLIALAAGGWWTVISPVLMTLLLLRISGVSLLEKDIADRRPGYRDYVRRTSAFIPWPPQARSGSI